MFIIIIAFNFIWNSNISLGLNILESRYTLVGSWFDLDLSNFAAKVDLEKATGVDTSNFVWKVDTASLKSEVAKLDTDKLEKVPTGWNSLKSKVDKLDIKLDAYNGKSQIFKVKYLILLT